jgi:transcriptional regulator with XRE-family HTH domain
LEDAGFTVGSEQDLLGLTDAEMELVKARCDVAAAIRKRRTQRKLTQPELAKLADTTQSRISKIEKAAPGVTMDVLLRTYFAAGGTWADVGRMAAKADKTRKTAAKDR